MGLPVSLILLAVGAILAFAVHHDPNAAVNVHVVGWILMAVGLVGILLSLFYWERWGPGYWYGERRVYRDRGHARRGYGGRRAVVEEEGPAPPGGPGGPYDTPPPAAPPPP